MIFGIGTDLCEIARIEKVWSKYGEHFVERLLMPEERVQFERTKRKLRFLAMHFAAKEAIVKAMGTGFRQGIWIRDVGFIQEPSGKPVPIFSANARRKCDEMGAGEGFVSLTDESGMVAAYAILLKKAGG